MKLKPEVEVAVVSEKVKKLSAHNGIKLLWCEEQTVFRWSNTVKHLLLPEMDGYVACNQYQAKLLETLPVKKPIYILYTPIDREIFRPAEKKPQVVVASKIGLQKNTEALIDVYSKLPKELHKLYVGSADMWGKSVYEYDRQIEIKMSKAADEYIKTASPLDTAKRIRESYIGINFSIYDVGSLFFLECGMSGLNFFAWWYHPQFDEYKNISRFKTAEECVSQIEALDGKLDPNTELVDEIRKKHSFDAFHDQLGQIVQEIFIGG